MATTVSIIYKIKDVFNQDDWDSIKEKYSCTICTELIYKQEWYQCIEGHSGCVNCWNNIISSSKQCPSCRLPVKSLTKGLSRCRYIERKFTNKKISCPYSFNQSIINSRENRSILELDVENGCKEIITVEQLDDHQKNCNSRFVKCNNDGCNNISRYNQHQQQHQNQCGYAIIQCELCEASIKRSSLTNHQKSCPSRIIVCNQCPFELKKSELADHIDNQCPNSIIECRFQSYGCNTQFKRSETSNHLQQVNHTEFMIKQIDQQSQQLESFKKDLELCKKVLELSNSYSNTWIISNFINKTGKSKPQLYSPIMNVSSCQFQLSTGFKNGYQHYYLHVMVSDNGEVKVKCSFKLLNCKDTSKSLSLGFERDIELNGWGLGYFPITEYSKESGYIFPDDSVHINVTINTRAALQS